MQIQDLVQIDPSSPTGLSWKVARPRCKVGEPALKTVVDGYYCGEIKGVSYKAHRVVFYLTHGYWPELVDHIDRCRTNNTPSNLRAATRAENAQNAKRKGFFWNGYSFCAAIGTNYGVEHLGSFSTILDARAAYMRAKAAKHTNCPVEAWV